MTDNIARPDQVEVQLTGEDGSTPAIVGRVSRALKRAGFREEAEAYRKAAFACKSYDEVLELTMNTVDVG